MAKTIYPTKMYKSPVDLAIKDVDFKSRTVAGYFNAFDIEDAYGEIVRKGAFAKTIKEQGPAARLPRIKHFKNHDINIPLSKLIDIKEDDYGGWYLGEVPDHNDGIDFLKMADGGLITEHSYGYKNIKVRDLKDGTKEVTEIQLWEISSLTGWGVNPFTPLTATLKSNDADAALWLAERVKKIDKFVRDSTATDECIQMVLLEYKQLAQLIEDMASKEATTEPLRSTSPDEKAVDWNLIALSLQ